MSAAIDYRQIYEGILSRLAELRRARDISEAKMLLAILDIETNEKEMRALELAGCENLERFIRSIEICDVARFRSFRVGVLRLGRDHALRVGAEATIEAAKIADGDGKAVAGYIEAHVAWSEQHSGALATRETAKRIRMQVAPRAEVPQCVKRKTEAAERLDEIARLGLENAQLRAQVSQLEKERDELKKRVVQLSKRGRRR